MLVGLGAVSTTFIAGVMAIRKGIAQPIGSLTQMGTSVWASAPTGARHSIKDFVPLASLDDIVFGGWDIFDDNCYEAADDRRRARADAARRRSGRSWRPSSRGRRCSTAATSSGSTARTSRRAPNKMDLAEQVRADIRRFKEENDLDRLVMIWCGSTEVFMTESEAHQSIEAFEKALADQRREHPVEHGLRLRGAEGGRSVRQRRAEPDGRHSGAAGARRSRTACPIAGKDFKTGQTLMKTIIAPGLKARLLGVKGWYSTNILGNRDGEVLDDPESFKTKEESKKSVLDYILQPDLYPDLYKDLCHVVRINYYPPRGDNKEGWDNIDIVGWLGYPMQLKINFLCRDSILAAPIVLDLALFLDMARARE